MPTVTALPTPPNRATDTPTEFADNADALLGALPTFVTELNAFADDLADENGVANYSATSTTSNSIGTGTKNFTIEAGKRFIAGDFILARDSAAPSTNYMYGTVTSYNSTTGALVMDSTRVGGSGTKTSWLVGLSGIQGIGGDVLPSFSGNAGKILQVNSGETAGQWAWLDNYIYLSGAYALTSTTATQKLFNSSTNGALTLPVGRHWFQMMVYLTSMSASSGNAAISLIGAGTATLANRMMFGAGLDGAVNTNITDTFQFAINSSSNQFDTMGTAGTNTTAVFHATGQFNVTVAGTIIPSVALNTSASAFVNVGSFFMHRMLGTATTNGSWS